MTMSKVIQLDQEYVWHPFTSLKSEIPHIHINKAYKCTLETIDGKKIIDAVSSWWVNIHGHSNPILANAITKQALKLEHVIFAGFTHKPAAKLAQEVISILPGDQAKAFFSDNGSTSVEVAIKMAIQYFYNIGKPRNKIIAFEGAYHGDTFGAMSLGERGLFNKPFESLFFEVDYIPFPKKGQERDTVVKLQDLIKNNEYAAFIFEPLMQGSAGMRTYSPQVLETLLLIAKGANVICIADEVLTGFGRTGRNFASAYLKKTFPDIYCLSKGLTGGMMPLGLTTCNQKIVDAFLHADKDKTFYHGHSYTANPLACAVARASLKLFLADECQNNIKRIHKKHILFTKKLVRNQHIKEIRVLGTMLALEIKVDEKTSYFSSIRDHLYNFFITKGILLRPLGNVLYILPPYVITNEELDKIYQAIEDYFKEFLTK